MATIGYATLQIIPSLQGVTEAIEKQVDGKVVNVTIEPKVSKPAAEKAGKQAKETVEKHTTQVKVEPKVDQKAAEKAGKQAGKTVSDGMASSVKSSGKEAAKVIVDGIADGVKQELPRGGIGEILVDGIADGVKQGIDGVGIGGDIVATINTGIKSGDLGGTIRDAVVPAISNVGREIRSGASEWAGGIANALRSGDIQGATDDIGNTVRTTTDLIADIGSTFGLQLDGVREFGDKAGTTLSQVGSDIQGVITKASDIYDTLNTVGTVLDTVLPRKAATGTGAMAKSWLSLIPVIGQVIAAWELGKTNPLLQDPKLMPDGSKVLVNPNGSTGASIGPDGLITIYDKDGNPRGGGIFAQPGAQRERRGYQTGGYTGFMPADKIAGVVHGGEYVINSSSTTGIENAYPGLLDYLNNKGKLPGFAGGGKVQLGNISGAGITTAEQQSMWDAVRGKFPNAVLTSATRTVMTEGHPDFHNAGRAIDISGPGMGAIASWIASTYPDSLELIHSPFGNNIKNGKNVGDGTGFYGAGLMAAHRDHVHWALGKTAMVSAPSSAEMLPALGLDASSSAAMTAPAATPESTVTSVGQSTSMNVPGSLSALPTMGLTDLGKDVGKTSAGTDLSIFSQAGASAVQGQVGSALGVFGVNDSPGWLKGLSSFIGGIKVSGGDGASAPSAAPLASTAAPVSAAVGAVQNLAAGAAPASVTNFNIQTTDIEPAYLASQRLEKERAAAKLARY